MTDDTEATLAQLEHQARISQALYDATLAAVEAGWSIEDIRDDVVDALRVTWPEADLAVP